MLISRPPTQGTMKGFSGTYFQQPWQQLLKINPCLWFRRLGSWNWPTVPSVFAQRGAQWDADPGVRIHVSARVCMCRWTCRTLNQPESYRCEHLCGLGHGLGKQTSPWSGPALLLRSQEHSSPAFPRHKPIPPPPSCSCGAMQFSRTSWPYFPFNSRVFFCTSCCLCK